MEAIHDLILADRYQLHSKCLGVGGSGRVFEATDLHSNSPVAVKLLTSEHSTSLLANESYVLTHMGGSRM
jgi:hypothetical protein